MDWWPSACPLPGFWGRCRVHWAHQHVPCPHPWGGTLVPRFPSRALSSSGMMGMHCLLCPHRRTCQTCVSNCPFLPLSSCCPSRPACPPAVSAVPRVAFRGPGGLRPAHPAPPIATAAWPSRPAPARASPASPRTTPASSPRMLPTPNRPPRCPQTSPARYSGHGRG